MLLCKHGGTKLALDSSLTNEAPLFVPQWQGPLAIIKHHNIFSLTLKINITKHIASKLTTENDLRKSLLCCLFHFTKLTFQRVAASPGCHIKETAAAEVSHHSCPYIQVTHSWSLNSTDVQPNVIHRTARAKNHSTFARILPRSTQIAGTAFRAVKTHLQEFALD